ncbi:hypothetical protein WME79_37785 [Sorangium sp. So ce726]|uniref:hypothetical protein n=1 Tax=Sorangium sp. So ce726 TaxID=3133319 RepID=UPI003F5F1E88
MTKAKNFAAGFAVAFMLATVSDGMAEGFRYSAFNCYGMNMLGHKSGVSEAAGIFDPYNSDGYSAYCPHTSSVSFPLTDVETVRLQFYIPTAQGGDNGGAKACVSWAYTSGGTSYYNVACDYVVQWSGTATGGQELLLRNTTYHDLDTWHNYPSAFSYVIVYSGGDYGEGTPPWIEGATFVGYKVSDS